MAHLARMYLLQLQLTRKTLLDYLDSVYDRKCGKNIEKENNRKRRYYEVESLKKN